MEFQAYAGIETEKLTTCQGVEEVWQYVIKFNGV